MNFQPRIEASLESSRFDKQSMRLINKIMKDSTSFSDFLNQYWEFLDERGWAGMILHDWERIPHDIDSDIDYIVHGPSATELVHGLIDYCKRHGWSLVQILEHEVDALYCVCFQNNAPFESVLLDVCWDYRRKGIDLIENTTLFEGAWRPAGRSFNVPSAHVEFLYRLIKSAAKAKDFSSLPDLEMKMRELFEENRKECMRVLAEVAGYEGADDWEGVKSFFDKADYFGEIRSGRKISMRELQLYSKRILRPTGLLIGHDDDSEISKIIEVVGVAFRRVESVQQGTPNWRLKSKLIKSTLVVRPGHMNDGKSGIFLPKEGEESADRRVKKVLRFLSARIKNQWSYRK